MKNEPTSQSISDEILGSIKRITDTYCVIHGIPKPSEAKIEKAKEIESIYVDYVLNPLAWMEANKCTTTREITLKLMQMAVDLKKPEYDKLKADNARMLEALKAIYDSQGMPLRTTYRAFCKVAEAIAQAEGSANGK